MSSKKKPKVENLVLLKSGKPKPAKDDSVIVRTVRSDHGYPKLQFPKSFLAAGMKLNEEVIIIKKGSNPLNWEITIKPRVLKSHSRSLETQREL